MITVTFIDGTEWHGLRALLLGMPLLIIILPIIGIGLLIGTHKARKIKRKDGVITVQQVK